MPSRPLISGMPVTAPKRITSPAAGSVFVGGDDGSDRLADGGDA
jgi:hypothetical protein